MGCVVPTHCIHYDLHGLLLHRRERSVPIDLDLSIGTARTARPVRELGLATF